MLHNLRYLIEIRICCRHYARVLNMQRYSYDNIITIVTNVITLELLSARFAYSGAR